MSERRKGAFDHPSFYRLSSLLFPPSPSRIPCPLLSKKKGWWRKREGNYHKTKNTKRDAHRVKH
jgi:hypothetical protein